MADGPNVDFYGFPYPTRMLVAALCSGEHWVWSPIKLTPELRAEVDTLGSVAHLVSPNKLHHSLLSEWNAAYPQATLWGPAFHHSEAPKRKDLVFEPPLEDFAPKVWGAEIDQAWCRGSFAMDEVVFFHRPSLTAIFADLIQAFDEHFLKAHWSWWQRPLAWLDGITARNPLAPLEWRLSYIDKAPARAVREKVLAWVPERVVIAHGEWAWLPAGGSKTTDIRRQPHRGQRIRSAIPP